MKHARCPLDGAELRDDRSSGFPVFLTYVPVLIFALSVGLWVWLLQTTNNNNLGTIESSPYPMGGELIRMKIRTDELQRLSVESKVAKTFLEEQPTRVSRQIDVLVSNENSANSGLASRPLKKKLHSRNETYYHEVQTGETLYRIARKYGPTVKQLVTINNLADPKQIYSGQKILIISDQGIAISRLN